MADNNIKIEPLLGNDQQWQHSYEQPISYAPLVQLANKNWVVPQHFLRYQHTLASVNEVLNDISFSTHFRVLVAEKNSGVYLQVAVLSPDNYRCDNKAKKLLFGRRWPVERNLPTSELIQTAFLALKVAREHEVRELFQLKHQGATSTPFNNHHDLPVMAQNPELVSSASQHAVSLNALIARLAFADAPIELIAHHSLASGEQLYTVQLHCERCQLSEFNQKQLSFLAANALPNNFLHSLINALINISNEYVGEHFKYQGFARFSQLVHAEKIGELSMAMRSPNAVSLCSMGKQQANQLNFEVDSARAPNGCGQAIGGFLAAHGIEQPENAHLYPHYV